VDHDASVDKKQRAYGYAKERTGLPFKDKGFIYLLQLKPSHLKRKREEDEIRLSLGGD